MLRIDLSVALDGERQAVVELEDGLWALCSIRGRQGLRQASARRFMSDATVVELYARTLSAARE